MEFLVRFSQVHMSFRLAELQALAEFEGVKIEIVEYNDDSPFCVVRLDSCEDAKALVRRSILTMHIHELWASGTAYTDLHDDLKAKTSHLWPRYVNDTFKFRIDTYGITHDGPTQLAMINSFAFLGFQGPVDLVSPKQSWTVFEDYDLVPEKLRGNPRRAFFGRYVGSGSRHLPGRFDLKKRDYIATTTMDPELTLVTANIALAGPGKIFLDPFVGTGSFPLACAEFGAVGFGSDIDGRTMRGHGPGKCLKANFVQLGLLDRLGSTFTSDLTNTPIRIPNPATRLFDGIVCDPPYGVREGLKVLGTRDPAKKFKQPVPGTEYSPPKKPYSFAAMLDNILMFAAESLVDNGRLSFWMPTANDDGDSLSTPTHPCLETVSVCTQYFRKWSRKLITYRRLPDAEVDRASLEAYVPRKADDGATAAELNPFREKYFSKSET